MLTDQADVLMRELLEKCPDDVCQRICALDVEIFRREHLLGPTDATINGAGIVVFTDQAFTSERARLWGTCADHGNQRGGRFRARLRRVFREYTREEFHEEFRVFCKAADSYFVGVLQRQISIALDQAIND